MQQFLSIAQNGHIDFCCSAPEWSYLARVRKNTSSRQQARFVQPFEKCVIHHDWIQSQAQKHARIPRKTVCIRQLYIYVYIMLVTKTYIDSVLCEIYDPYEAAHSTSSNCDGELADRVPKRQRDLATRMMLEKLLFSSNGDNEQSIIFQLSLNCIDRAVESITEFVSIRVRFMHQHLYWVLSTLDQCFVSLQPILCHPHTQIRIILFHDEQRDILNLEFSPSHAAIGFSQIAFPTTVLPKGDRINSLQEEQLGLPYWTMILAICVVVDESKCLDIPILELSIICEHLPFLLGSKLILRLLLVHRKPAIWRWYPWF